MLKNCWLRFVLYALLLVPQAASAGLFSTQTFKENHSLDALAKPRPPAPEKLPPQPIDVPAGSLRNQADAKRKCPRVCAQENLRWTDSWTASAMNATAVCRCVAP